MQQAKTLWRPSFRGSTGGTYGTPPDHLAGFQQAASLQGREGKEGKGKGGRRDEGREERVRRRERRERGARLVFWGGKLTEDCSYNNFDLSSRFHQKNLEAVLYD